MTAPICQTTGRRKQAVARVRFRHGQGAITCNGHTFEEYFTSATHRMIVTEPLRLTETTESWDIDVTIDGGPSDRESARTTPGAETVIALMEGAADEADVMLGMTVCFDLRFPELYRELTLAGAAVLAVPSNFTEATGRDHWEVLLRARAIENGAFVIAPAQCGIGGGVPTHGRSMIVDPWGIVIAQAPDGPGVVVADLEIDRVAAARRQIPSGPSA